MEEIIDSNKRGSGGKVYTESFDQQRIDRLKNIVLDFYTQGEQKRYGILVDGEMVVPINTDSRKFDRYKKYIEGHTKSIEVRMYFGESPTCNRYIFHTNETAINGVSTQGVEERIKEALEKQQTEIELQRLQEELKRKNKKLKAYKELEAELKEKKIDIKELLKEGIQLFGEFKKIKEPSGTPLQGVKQSEVEVEIQTEKTKTDKHYTGMKEKYGEENMLRALGTWEVFIKNPQLKEEFKQIINQKTKKNGKA
jgi:hypothetical protein